MNINTAVDEVRRQEWGKAKKTQKKFIKGSRYILLANEENLDEQESANLFCSSPRCECERRNGLLPKEQFRTIHTYRYPALAKKALEQWCEIAKESGLAPFQRFARGFRKQADQVVAYCKHRIALCLIEGFNDLVSSIAPVQLLTLATLG